MKKSKTPVFCKSINYLNVTAIYLFFVQIGGLSFNERANLLNTAILGGVETVSLTHRSHEAIAKATSLNIRQ